MASIFEIQELAAQLSLSYIARGDVNLQKETISNLDYLKYVLESELAARRTAAIQKHRQPPVPEVPVMRSGPFAVAEFGRGQQAGRMFCVHIGNLHEKVLGAAIHMYVRDVPALPYRFVQQIIHIMLTALGVADFFCTKDISCYAIEGFHKFGARSPFRG